MSRLICCTMLVLALVHGFSSVAAQDSESIHVMGDVIAGSITEDETELCFRFEGRMGDVLVPELVWASNLAIQNYARLEFALVLPNGTTTRLEDAERASFRPEIIPFRLPVDGTYTLVLQVLEGTISGDFVLTLRRNLLEYGETVSGSIDQHTPQLSYVIEGSKGDMITLVATARYFDPVLTLEDAHGSVLAMDDDSAGNLMPRIGPLPLPEDGLYSVTITGYADSREEYDHFDLRLDRLEGDLITYSTVIKVPDNDYASRQYAFAGSAGEVLELSVLDPPAHATFRLVAPSGAEVRAATASEDIAETWAYVVLPEYGGYVLHINTRADGVESPWQFMLRQRGINGLTENSLLIRLSEKNPATDMRFMWPDNAGAVQVNVLHTHGSPIYVLDITSSGEPLATYISRQHGATIQIRLTRIDGEVLLELIAVPQGTTTYAIWLDVLPDGVG